MSAKKYKVALSFAGEQRDYVEKVANSLKEKGVDFFYDRNNEIEMWGGSLVEYFEKVFKNESDYIVLFLSKEYAEKAWPSFEREVALGRWIFEKRCIFPVRFDKTEIPGLPDTISYLNIKNLSPEELADAIMTKIGIKYDTAKEKTMQTEKSVDFRVPKKKVNINPYKERNNFIAFVTKELERRCEVVDGLDFYSEDVGDKVSVRILSQGDDLYSIDIHKNGLSNDNGVSFSYGQGSLQASGFNAHGNFEWDTEKEEVVLNYTNFSVFKNGEEKITFLEYCDQVWDTIIELLE
ncbi:hypothetical protein C0583_00335 [Candidatus Parcubacteria bacterium]|nr:MAG: hypothetical protein C0583_00335 [Candidatus Parcubacteria bacterium]